MELNGIVRLSEQFQKAEAANRILKIPTGDGMALVFYKSPEEPAQCAFEISRALKNNQRLQVRMGIHSGPVSGVVDVIERTNVAGAGINLNQRVMDCGDAGHILLSHHVAEDLAEYERWRPLLHDIGTFEVKHGVRVSVTNLYSDEVGNPNLPSKLQAVKKHRSHVRWAAVAIGLLVLGAVVAAFMIVSRRPSTSLTAIPEKSIAVLPFVNMSADKEQRLLLRRHLRGTAEPAGRRCRSCSVTARTSSFAFKGKEVGIPEIARTLHVANVLEGSVRKSGDTVRITAQLIRAGDGTHLWSQTYDRKLDDIFAIQDEIAADVVEAAQGDAARRGADGAPDRSARRIRCILQADPRSTAVHRRGACQQSTRSTARCSRSIRATRRRLDGLARNFVNETNMGLCPATRGSPESATRRRRRSRSIRTRGRRTPTRRLAMNDDNDLAGAAASTSSAHWRSSRADLDVLPNSCHTARRLSVAWMRRWRSTRPSSAAIR